MIFNLSENETVSLQSEEIDSLRKIATDEVADQLRNSKK